MHAAQGILTTRGGMTSHAAVVARGMGRPCVAGAGGISIDYGAQTLTAPAGMSCTPATSSPSTAPPARSSRPVPMVEPTLSGDFATLMEWADEIRRLKVRTNAETPLDAETARKFGAEGIGLCRTEHMFFDPERIGAVRQMILAADERRPPRRARQAAAVPAAGLRRPVPHHGGAAGHHPPARPAAARVPAARRGRTGRGGEGAGHRRRGDAPRAPASWPRPTRCSAIAAAGSASPIPEIYEMQARAIFEAAVAVAKETGTAPIPEIMIPLVGTKKELEITRAQVDRVAKEVFAETGDDHRVHRRHHDRAAARRADRRQDRRGRRLLQLRHQRPDPDHLRAVARRRRQVPAAYVDAGHPAEGPVRVDRHRGRRRADADRRRARPRDQARASSSASAASTAATRPRSRSATRSGSTTSPAAPTACRWPAWPPPRRR